MNSFLSFYKVTCHLQIIFQRPFLWKLRQRKEFPFRAKRWVQILFFVFLQTKKKFSDNTNSIESVLSEIGRIFIVFQSPDVTSKFVHNCLTRTWHFERNKMLKLKNSDMFYYTKIFTFPETKFGMLFSRKFEIKFWVINFPLNSLPKFPNAEKNLGKYWFPLNSLLCSPTC